jgi:hypothetical protein
MRLLIAGYPDEAYFREQSNPSRRSKILYIGPVDVWENELFPRPTLLHRHHRRFGLVLTEASRGQSPSSNEPRPLPRFTGRQTGFLVDNVTEGTSWTLKSMVAQLDRVQQYFSIDTMVEGYEQVYSMIFDLEAKKMTMKRKFKHPFIIKRTGTIMNKLN